jgi:hypothetical protein
LEFLEHWSLSHVCTSVWPKPALPAGCGVIIGRIDSADKRAFAAHVDGRGHRRRLTERHQHRNTYQRMLPMPLQAAAHAPWQGFEFPVMRHKAR